MTTVQTIQRLFWLSWVLGLESFLLTHQSRHKHMVCPAGQIANVHQAWCNLIIMYAYSAHSCTYSSSGLGLGSDFMTACCISYPLMYLGNHHDYSIIVTCWGFCTIVFHLNKLCYMLRCYLSDWTVAPWATPIQILHICEVWELFL